MDSTDRIAEQIARLPPELKQLLDTELAAGNQVIEAEHSRPPEKPNLAIILERTFSTQQSSAPVGVLYREIAAQDRTIFEFYTADEGFSLVNVKFKPMVLPKLGPWPENPTEAHIARMKAVAEREEAAARERLAGLRQPAAPIKDPKFGDAANRFIASMTMTFDMWHDGTGYDLAALRELSPSELKAIETTLIHHQPRDWRDIEALARIDSEPARQAIEAALKSSDPHVRRAAMEQMPHKIDPSDRERLLVQSLTTANLYGGLSQAIDEAAEFHPPAVIDALFRGALDRDGEVAVNFAGLLFYLHGKATEPFDWNQRPFFLRFSTSDRAERQAVFREMCQTLGVDAGKFLREP